MTMNAEQLNDLVESVPGLRERLPIKWGAAWNRFHFGCGPTTSRTFLPDDLAEHIIGFAMVTWLVEAGHAVIRRPVDRTRFRYWPVEASDYECANLWHEFGQHEDYIEALAAACRDLKGASDDAE